MPSSRWTRLISSFTLHSMRGAQKAMDIREALTVTPEWYGMITWDAYTQAYGHGTWHAVQQDFVTRIGIPLGSTVLDVGTGAGGTAIEAARVVGPSGHVTGIDNAIALVEIARDEARRSDIGNVLFEVMDLGDLRFPDSSFDCVLSHFALNGSFPPGVGAREAYRVLRPGGELTFTMFGAEPRGSELFQLLDRILARFHPAELSACLSRVKNALTVAPYGFFQYGPLAEPADIHEVMRFLGGLGFENLQAVVRHFSLDIPSVESLLTLYAPLQIELREMSNDEVARYEQAAAVALEPFFQDGGAVPQYQYEVMYFSARKSSAS
jgi:ubiquinone/menaquinone biosynthesis C-methylase UbiE